MALTLEDVWFAYRARGPWVLRGIHARLDAGTITAICGPNGAGKSTLLKIMAGLLTPSSGLALLDGCPLHAMRHAQRAKQVAYMAQRQELAFAFTVRQAVRLGRYAHGERDADRVVATALAAADLRGHADEPLGRLSAGQQQRAALARVLAQLEVDNPRPGSVLLADEPLAALDPAHALAALERVADLARRGVACALVLHDLSLARRVCDRALVLDATGRCAAAGSVRQTLVPRVLDPVFDVEFHALGDPGDRTLQALIPARRRAAT